MLTQENQVEIRVMHRQGMPIRAIARQLKISRNTVRTVLRGKAPRGYGPRASRATKLQAFEPYLRERVVGAGAMRIPATVLLREIRERGYRGGATQLKVFVKSLQPPPRPDPGVRFETAPGEQMQADFVVFRRNHERLSAFVATLEPVMKLRALE
jgi:transposase